MLKITAHGATRAFSTTGLLMTAALCSGCLLSGCMQNSDTGDSGTGRNASAGKWQQIETSDDLPFVLEINLDSIKTSEENASWRDYQIQVAPSPRTLAQYESSDAVVSYTVIDGTLDCSNRTSRANAQRTYLQPHGQGQQASTDPVKPVFVPFGNLNHEKAIISMVCP